VRLRWIAFSFLFACNVDPGGVDEGGGWDSDVGGLGDLSTSELDGTSPGDLGVDLTSVDLTAPPVDRYVFVLPQRAPLFASATAADDACKQAATAATLGPVGATYHALLQFRDPAPTTHDRNPLTSVDRVILPSGAVVSTGSAFWGAHTVDIDELADKSKVTSACVWTGFNASGDRLSADSGDCTTWTSTSVGDVGYAGIIHSVSPSGLAWAYGAVQTCDVSCFVYCLQQ
jgi:hypothetical protein